MEVTGLNPPQQEAASHVRGPLVVFAGAGSGKTRVITHRIANLVSQHDVPPYKILAVTFTNKAAGELRERLSKIVPGAAADLWVGTFHAICARLLRKYADMLGLRRDFVIYDDADQKAMVTRLMRDLQLDEKRYAPKVIAGLINRAKQEGHGPEDMAPTEPQHRVAQDVYRVYDKKMTECGALDFGDLIYRMVIGMRQHPEFLQELQERFTYVLVDEFQDTNHVQFELVAKLCDKHRNLCVVGDDDQSIYRWRGADRRNILNFQRFFTDATIIKLEQNYRSSKHILNAANAVVQRNLDREPKRLWTDNEEGSPVTVVSCEDERDEAQMVLSAIGMLLENDYARNDIALLYRTHAQSRVLEEALRFANLPYRIVGGQRFYDRAEVKDLLAYLRLLVNPDDDVSLLRVVNTPTRGIGKTTVTKLLELAASDGTSVYQALEHAVNDQLFGAASKRLSIFRDLVRNQTLEAAAGARPSEVAQNILTSTGYISGLKKEDTAEADGRLENLGEAISSMIEFEQDAEIPTLTAFLELVTLQTDNGQQDDTDTLTLMTVHAAKGLEFAAVFVAGMEEETFPHRGFGIDDDPDELEEERRLAYVAFTRAEERLFLTHTSARRVYGEVRFRRRSRFIDEMPQADLNLVGRNLPPHPARGSHPRYEGQVQQNRSPTSLRAPKTIPGDSYVDTAEACDGAFDDLRVGMRVRHSKFGVGSVQEITAGMPPRVTVLFPGWGRKQILTRFLLPV